MRSPLEQGSVLESEPTGRATGEPPRQGRRGFLKELPILILIAFGLAMLMKTFLVQAFWIPSESMEPTLIRGDRVLVNKLAFRFRDPRRGEVVVFARPSQAPPRSLIRRVVDFVTEGLGSPTSGEQDLIKRVIGLPGETVEMHDAIVTITRADGSKLTLAEPYLADERDLRPFESFVVPADSYFMMGDNRAFSDDSRFTLGAVKRDQMIGKAFVKVWPPGRWDLFDVPAYGGEATAAAILVFGGRPRPRRRAA